MQRDGRRPSAIRPVRRRVQAVRIRSARHRRIPTPRRPAQRAGRPTSEWRRWWWYWSQWEVGATVMPNAATTEPLRVCCGDSDLARLLDSRAPRCHAIVLAGQHLLTGWHGALTARRRSAACFDSLREFTE